MRETYSGTRWAYAPYSVSVGLDFYPKELTWARSQAGVKFGAILAEDAGPGILVSGLYWFRLSRHIVFDGELGWGEFLDMRASLRRYVSYLPGSYDLEVVDNRTDFLSWGFGLSLGF